MSKGNYYITTAIVYTSGKPHIGNTYEAVLADSIARFRRMSGYDVFYMTGTDEHGQKIQMKAAEQAMEPKAFVDGIAAEIQRIWGIMGSSHDKFIRTTDPLHEKTVQRIFEKLYAQGDIYEGIYEGWYCTPCESFWTETQLEAGKCPDCGREVVKSREESYFFRLSKYRDRLMKHIEDNPHFIQPESRKNEMINNFLKPGLQDLCVSRTSFDWGIKVPFNKKHVIYVWIDALSNYITGLGYDPDGNHGELFGKYWPADVHLIGKDILRFHTLYWPIMLMALGIELPKQIFGHPWLNMGAGKMSKSRGNVIYADDLVEFFGVDAVRYYVLHETPFAQDGAITYDLIIERINSDLANILGNLVNRTITMVNKYFGGVVLKPGDREDIDDELISLALKTPAAVEEKMMELRVSDAIDEIFTLLRRSNKYIDETSPWLLGKDEARKGRLATVLYNLLESIRFAAVLLQPFMPETAARMLRQLNTGCSTWESLADFNGIRVNDTVGKPEILFARIDPEVMLGEISARNEKKEEKEEVKINETIIMEDFARIKLRTARITSVEKIEGTDKLLKLSVDMGSETRQIVSGIASDYTEKELVGKNIVVIANLMPIKLRGVLSEGMILAAEDQNGLSIVTLDKDVKPGSPVR
ncbi:MAG: methionine--tRNA ligase [Clostridia bacterium]|nr:methionine--tRNA ligase [Clostridia bacterium]